MAITKNSVPIIIIATPTMLYTGLWFPPFLHSVDNKRY